MKKTVALLATLVMLAGIALAGAQTAEPITTGGADSAASAADGDTTAGMVATAVAVVAMAVAVPDSDNTRIRAAH